MPVADRQQEIVAGIIARNKPIVAAELERRGGHCVYEGCTETNIEWHHRDPATKTAEISSCVRGSVDRLKRELALCDPLCRKHHLIVDGRLAAIQKRERSPQSSLGPNTKLTERQVRSIRDRWKNGETIVSLARSFDVTITTISNVVYRKLWGWLPD